MYTVTFIDANTGENKISRYAETKRAAISWAKWLRNQSFASQTTVYQGMSGEMVIERFDKGDRARLDQEWDEANMREDAREVA